MATAPLKSQPLHNFSLPQLRWGHKHNIHHHHHRSPPAATTPAAESLGGNGETTNRSALASCSSQKAVAEREDEEREKEKEKEKEKPWNLRPRKAVARIPSNGGGELNETAPLSENLPKFSPRLRGYVEGRKKEKEEEEEEVEDERRKDLCVALRAEEIGEDVYAMTGSRPARRPRKRPKTVQKQLDSLFPGLYLAGITPDSYRVDDAPR